MKKTHLVPILFLGVFGLVACGSNNPSPKQYAVLVTANELYMGTVIGGGNYTFGTQVTINAAPNSGYTFKGWYKDGSQVSTDVSYSFTMPANNINYTAKFGILTPWYQKEDWWNYCSNGIDGQQATEEDIGKEVELTVNGQVHGIRLIDVDHDELNDGSGNKAHCTFEFINLLSDSDGYSLATLWDTSNGSSSTNYNYLDSDLRYALDGKGGGKDRLRWYQKRSGTKSTDYTKPVIEMLPEGLQNKIKTVKKYVANDVSYTVKDYDAKVFVLTYGEMTQSSSVRVREGKTYKYYVTHNDNSSRIKHQINWHDGAATDYTKISDPDITWYAINYAGYNDSKDSCGGNYWFPSPYPNENLNHYVWYILSDGRFYYDCSIVYEYAYAVAPAFCI